jgi:hypothetical protein
VRPRFLPGFSWQTGRRVGELRSAGDVSTLPIGPLGCLQPKPASRAFEFTSASPRDVQGESEWASKSQQIFDLMPVNRVRE